MSRRRTFPDVSRATGPQTLYDALCLSGGGSGGAAHENVYNFVRGYPFRHRASCLDGCGPGCLYDFWRLRGRWLGHGSQGMERMPRNDARASSLRTWLHLEASATGLWADRQGLALERDDLSSNRHPALSFLFEHDLFGTPQHTFPDHAPGPAQQRLSLRCDEAAAAGNAAANSANFLIVKKKGDS